MQFLQNTHQTNSQEDKENDIKDLEQINAWLSDEIAKYENIEHMVCDICQANNADNTMRATTCQFIDPVKEIKVKGEAITNESYRAIKACKNVEGRVPTHAEYQDGNVSVGDLRYHLEKVSKETREYLVKTLNKFCKISTNSEIASEFF